MIFSIEEAELELYEFPGHIFEDLNNTRFDVMIELEVCSFLGGLQLRPLIV